MDHNHLSFIFYHNLIGRLPLYEINNKLHKNYKRSEEAIMESNNDVQKDEKVPRILHKFWITHHENPFGAPENLYDALKETVDEHPGFQIYFWVMEVENIRSSLVPIKRIDPQRVEIKRAGELIEMMSPKTKEFFDFLYDGRRLAKTSDLLRFFALHKYGGIYTDLDIKLKRDFVKTLKYDFTFFVFGNKLSYIVEVYYIAAMKEHPVLMKYVNDWENFENVAGKALRIVKDFEIHWHMTTVYTLATVILDFLFRNPETAHNCLLLPATLQRKLFYHWNDQSWQKSKYGNRKSSQPPVMFDRERFDEYLAIMSRPLGVEVTH